MFSHNGSNGPESKTTRVFCPVRNVAVPGANLLSTILRFFEKLTTDSIHGLPFFNNLFHLTSTMTDPTQTNAPHWALGHNAVLFVDYTCMSQTDGRNIGTN